MSDTLIITVTPELPVVITPAAEPLVVISTAVEAPVVVTMLDLHNDYLDAVAEDGYDGTFSEWLAMFKGDPGINVSVVEVPASVDYTIEAPAGTPEVNDTVRYFITTSAPINLYLGAGVSLATLSTQTLPIALESNKTYIAQIVYTGTFWMLVTLVG